MTKSNRVTGFVLGIVCSVFSLNVYAEVWLGNALLGISGGYMTRKSLVVSSVSTANNFLGYSRDASDNGWLGAGFAGYQAIHQQWLLGAELNIEWEAIEHTHRYFFATESVTAAYRRKGVFDLSGRVGYAFTPNWMPYVRVGGEISRDDLRSNFVDSVTSINLFNKAWIHRFIVGLGAEMPIPDVPGLTVRLEYDYHSKGKTIEDYAATGTTVPILSYYTAMQPRSYSGRISVVWNFFESCFPLTCFGL